ncbi:hypothetical protein [Cohnella panacarvi]|uniref:hypothetical protein n=1 Tax=Cohnella panacarvi TaxID=400776 RepID=UPI00047D5DF4|nr:hypothetical protein [Cohnella panacarvi]
MMAALSYLFRYYVRSYRYVAPLIVYMTVIIFIYGVVPNPVLSSYGLTSTVLFLVMAWLCFAYIDVEDRTQQTITVLHLGSTTKYYMAKMAVIALIGTILALCTAVYPVVFGKFSAQPTAEQFIVGLVSHVLLSYLGIAISAIFTSKLILKLNYSILGLFLVLSISLAGSGITERLPDQFAFVTWLIPPSYRVMAMLNEDADIDAQEALMTFAAVFVYVMALQIMFLRWMKKRLF